MNKSIKDKPFSFKAGDIKDIVQKGREEFEDMKCTGMRCTHETSEAHYIVGKSHIDSRLIEVLEGVMGEIPAEKPIKDHSKSPMYTYKDVTMPHNRGYNAARSDILALITNYIDAIKCPKE